MYREAPIKNGMFDYNEFTRSTSQVNNKLNLNQQRANFIVN